MKISHADGTVKFWDTSSLTLQVLYRLKTGKVFDKSRSVKTHRPESSEASSSSSAAAAVAASSEPSQQHLGVKRLAMCPENRLLAVAGASGHVVLFKFRRQEASSETTVRKDLINTFYWVFLLNS
jgi:syntaxin-binding protein 5